MFKKLKLKLEDILTDFIVYLEHLKKTTDIKKEKRFIFSYVELRLKKLKRVVFNVLRWRVEPFYVSNFEMQKMLTDCVYLIDCLGYKAVKEDKKLKKEVIDYCINEIEKMIRKTFEFKDPIFKDKLCLFENKQKIISDRKGKKIVEQQIYKLLGFLIYNV